MFAYCGNDPVMGYDPTGAMPCYTFLGDNNIFSDRMLTGGFGGGGNTGVPGCGNVSKERNSNKPKYGDPHNLFNDNEQVVLTTKSFAFYKGVLVIKCSFLDENAISFGVILMGDQVTNPELVKHERGHVNQLIELGVWDYLSYVAMPSVTCFWLTKWEVLPDSLYHSLPWEYKANEYGNATFDYTEWANTVSDLYWFLVGIKSATS